MTRTLAGSGDVAAIFTVTLRLQICFLSSVPRRLGLKNQSEILSIFHFMSQQTLSFRLSARTKLSGVRRIDPRGQ